MAARHVIELGSRTVAGDWPYSGPVRPLFEGAAYLGIDMLPGPNVDVVADAATWPDVGGGPTVGTVDGLTAARWADVGVDISAQPVSVSQRTNADTVVCCETLEHAPEAGAICHNAHRLLRAGGVFICTAAGEGRAPHSGIDGGPIRAVDTDGSLEFYRNVSRDELRDWLLPFGFALIDTSNPGDIYAIAVKLK
jgi:SAM-dependent methyltransferase